MDEMLLGYKRRDTPRFNDDICNGLASKHLQAAELYIDQVFKSMSKRFPKGVVYHRYSRCTLREAYAIASNEGDKKREMEIAKSDVYLVNFHFTCNGKEIKPIPMYLPFARDGGFINLRGNNTNILPVLADRVISVTSNSVFVAPISDRLTFVRNAEKMICNGLIETVQIVNSRIYHYKPKSKFKNEANGSVPTPVHYLLAKYGFQGMFQRYCKKVPVVLTSESDLTFYPQEEWFVFKSDNSLKRGSRKVTLGADIALAVRKEDITPLMKKLICGFLYISKYFPNDIVPEYLESERMWLETLGLIYCRDSEHKGKLHDSMRDHIESFDLYLDAITDAKLKKIGIHVENIYDLLAIIIEEFDNWLINSSDKISSMYNKEISVLYYALFDITSSIVKMCYKFSTISKKFTDEEKSSDRWYDEISKILTKYLDKNKIFQISKNSKGIIENISSPGDCKAYKVTSALIPQERTNRNTQPESPDSIIKDPARVLHSSIVLVCQYAALTKSGPDGRNKISPYLQFTEDNVVLENPEFKPLLDDLQQKLRRV